MSLPAPSVEYETPRIPLVGHLAALGIVLVLVLAIVGTTSIFSADEGAAIIQARSLADGEGWIVEHPLPEIDPDNAAYPIELSATGAGGIAPFAKHPGYATALGLTARIADMAGMLALSVAGTLLAAWSAARLSERVRSGSAVLALWVTGVATPLFFASGLVIAHALSAGLSGAAALGAVKAVETRKPLYLLASASFAALAVLVRGEGVLFAAALAVAFWLVARRSLGLAWATGGAALIGGVGASAYLANERLTSVVIGGTGGVVQSVPAAGGSLVTDRVFAFVVTWLLPAYDPRGIGTMLLVIAVICAVLAGLLWRARIQGRRTRAGDGGIVFLLVASAAALVLRLLGGDHQAIPGLLVAVPYLLTAAALLRRDSFASLTARLCGLAAVLAAGTTLLTQYRTGGSGEWGGRYFAIVLPLLVPVLLPALLDGLAVFDERRRRAASLSLVVGTLAVALLAVGTLRSAHAGSEEYVAVIADVSASAGEPGDGGSPVVVATHGWVPRAAFDLFDERRWLLVDDGDDGLAAEQLESIAAAMAGSFDAVTVVAEPGDRFVSILGEHMTVAESRAVVESRDDLIHVFEAR